MAANVAPFPKSSLRSAEKVRSLPVRPPAVMPTAAIGPAGTGPDLPPDDPYLQEVKGALADGFGGIILAGPPGTSKTWYAARLAAALTGNDPARVRFLQFHPSYQYDDFVQGWVPEGGHFELANKHLLVMAGLAAKASGQPFILVIDELSRTDPARVFGEALTYIEASKRGQSFSLASGTKAAIPPNLIIIATMNTFDRGVDDVDAAFDRRFAKLEMLPDERILEQFLNEATMELTLRKRVLRFFGWLQRHPNPHCRIGHTYFRQIADETGLKRRWRQQLRFVLKKAFPLSDPGFKSVEDAWEKIFTQDSEREATPEPQPPQ